MTTATTSNPMTRLYNRLSRLGLKPSYIKKSVLPEWWDDEIATKPAGYAEALLHLARHLGVSLASLQNDAAPIELRNFGPCKFKKTSGTSEDDLALARTIATRAAQLAEIATADPFNGLSTSAVEIRLEILDRGANWVGLADLVRYCWSIGVPVLHIANMPPTIKKMHGMAARVNGRPVIVLSKRDKPTAWSLFILAHELGHVALGHIIDDGVLVDEEVDNNELDAEETAANEFAAALLTGEPNIRFHAASRWPSADALAQKARLLGREMRIDPGYIVLNYAHSMSTKEKTFWPVANAALKKLEPHANAPELIRHELAARLDWSVLPEDSSAFLMRMTEARRDNDLPVRQ